MKTTLAMITISTMFLVGMGTSYGDESSNAGDERRARRQAWRSRLLKLRQACEKRKVEGTATSSSSTTNAVNSTDRTAKGAKEKSWTNSVEYENPRGAGSATASGTAVKTENGAEVTIDRSGANARGTSWTSTTEGEVTKTEDGRQFTGTTTGSDDKGHSWTAEKEASHVVNEDGTVTITKDVTKTLEDGTEISKSIETNVTKTEDGRTWETTATKTGPKGASTMTGTGEGTKNDDGSFSWTAERQGENAKGKTWSSTAEGEGTRTENGRQWNKTTTNSVDGVGEKAKSSSGSLTHSDLNSSRTVSSERSTNRSKAAKERRLKRKANRSGVDRSSKSGAKSKHRQRSNSSSRRHSH